uniref:Uncharacterized protein n=1 Tax=Phlebotomus papatasi TaxID=29031 RepID=A0A1B0DMG7_PHLPP
MTEYSASGAEVMIKQEESEEIEEMCRLCVARSISFFSVFSENLQELLATHLGVSISESDNWPKFVCSGCVEKVHDVVHFITTIRESENILRDLFGERENIPRIVNVLSGEQCKSIKEEVEKSPTNQDSGILRQMLLGDISKCSYITQKLSLPSPSTSLLRDQLLKPLPSRPKRAVRSFSKDHPIKRRRRRRAMTSEEIEATQARIEKFYRIQCDICKDIFVRFRDLEDHFQDIHSRKAYIRCCKLKFSGLTNLSEHIQYHADPETFRCHECGKCFKYQCSLDFHALNTHTPHEMRKYPCPSCPQRFVTSKMLRQHAIVHAAADEKKHNCPHCQRAFERLTCMKRHVRTFHEGGANIICQTFPQFSDTSPPVRYDWCISPIRDLR